MLKRFILLCGIFLGCQRPLAAQKPEQFLVPAPKELAPTRAIGSTSSIGSRTKSRPMFSGPRAFNVRFDLPFAEAYARGHRLDQFSPIEEVKTPVLTQATLSLTRFWDGRLQLDAFNSTLHLQNGFGNGDGRHSSLSGQNIGYFRSAHLSGLRLSIRFGSDEQSSHMVPLWRRVSQMVDAALN